MKITESYLRKLIKETLTQGITSEKLEGKQITLTINVGSISSYSLANQTASLYIRNYMKQNYPKNSYLIPRLVPTVNNDFKNWTAIITIN
jgi:hypothetical protein